MAIAQLSESENLSPVRAGRGKRCKTRAASSKAAQAPTGFMDGVSPQRIPQNLLAQYFKDVATLPVLKSEEEFEIAKNIERLEVSLWADILGHPSLIPPLLSYLESRLPEKIPSRISTRFGCESSMA